MRKFAFSDLRANRRVMHAVSAERKLSNPLRKMDVNEELDFSENRSCQPSRQAYKFH